MMVMSRRMVIRFRRVVMRSRMVFRKWCGGGKVWQVVTRRKRIKVEWIVDWTGRLHMGVGRRFIVDLCRSMFRFWVFVHGFCRFINRFCRRIVVVQRMRRMRRTVLVQYRTIVWSHCWLLQWNMIPSRSGDQFFDGVDLVHFELFVAVDPIDCSCHCSIQDGSKECCRIWSGRVCSRS